jgi:hypothetical protein
VSNPLRVSPLKRLRFAPVALTAGIFAAVLLSLSLTGTLSGFAASITNSNNTAGAGTLIMQEQNAGATVTCLSTDSGSVSTNSATCATINKFGGSTTMTPGNTVNTAISIKNTGTASASTFTLTPGAACTQTTPSASTGSATDLCAKMNIVITSGATTVFSGTLASFKGAAATAFTMPAAPAAGASTPFNFAVTLDSSAGNTYQGLAASVPMTWTFTA